MITRSITAALAALVLPLAAQAAQAPATAGIFDGNDYVSHYTGPGGQTALTNQALGEVVDGGNGAFDAFGFYNSGVNGLGQTRQVDLLSGNVFRFFDTFTNTGATTVSTTLNFFGNLGSDGDELVSRQQSGLIVSCENSGAGSCGNDPVLALVSGNNGLGHAAITPDRYNVSYAISLNPGQSLSLLHFAFLARDENGPTADDVTLADTTGQALLTAPRLEGLSAEQASSIANYTLAPVPEPATWAMAALGLLVVGGRLRRSQRNTGLASR